MGKLATGVLSRIRLIFWVGMFFTVMGGYYSFQLYSNLRTDLEELLPTSSRSVLDLNKLASRLLSIDNLAILVFSKDTQSSKRFVIDLATKLATFPKSEVAGIEYRIDRELDFFKKRQLLYLELNDLTKIQSYIDSRIEYEKSLYNPLSIFSSEAVSEPHFDFRSLQARYASRAGSYSHFPDGYYATPDETKRVILINASGKALGIHGIQQLTRRVKETVAALQPHTYAPDLEVHYAGSVEETLEEQEALIEDLALSTILVLILVSAVMLNFFRLFWPTFALLVSLLGGTLWTFGISYFAVGYLNANSAFLGSIVLGNGVNFGIILLARYLEERRLGHAHLRSCHTAITKTWKATLTAALAAGLSYGSLVFTSFRGFNQFGIIGLIGMVVCWICTYTFLPAILTVIEGLCPIKASALAKRRPAPFTDFAAAFVSRWPGIIVSFSVVVTMLACACLTQVDGTILETNLKNLRSKRSIEKGAAFYNTYLNEIFNRFLTPIVILPSTRQNALEIAERLTQLKREQGSSSNIVSVQTIDEFVPRDQGDKHRLIKEIRSTLTPRILQRLSPEDQAKVRILLTPEVFHDVGPQSLPPLIRDKFTEKDGSIGKLVVVEPPLTDDIWAGDQLEQFISTLRSVADSVQPGTPVAGGMAVTADLVSSISHDGPRATALAFVSVLLLVIILFRDPRIWLPTLFALIVGVTWFGALVVLLSSVGLKINFLNFVALPITFGIGVDYGVNIFQRYHQQADRDIVRVIRETGGAVGLSSITTIIGYSSLLMASNKGFVSFGLLAVLGELACVTTAVIVLPAVLAITMTSRASHEAASQPAASL